MRVSFLAVLAIASAAGAAPNYVSPPQAFLDADIESPTSQRIFETPLKVKDFVAMIDPVQKCDMDGAKVQGWTSKDNVYSLHAEYDDKITNKRETMQFRFKHAGTRADPLTIESPIVDAATRAKQPTGDQWVALLRTACAKQGVDVGKMKPGAPEASENAQPAK
jgi:hypothetical protein